ncbi:hypothetical protein EROM_030540 [Encephalitozoon romaleae SJ-2008]|uniref:Uncharacterized protein n=1 Tax=Encephalitozoon romaleae (strain SJ-2008) TaxID=1178016 RepID=I7ADN2_ENCRO|nr:hypothetical protein EROM_030540 [Encephalitozoon romaleae SJ-2008]AFN82675.1 hypothetical protein EROM_030540 [Encephalitozoon romaleae SJ-2008]
MEESEELRYLMRLVPEYMRIGGEGYILHRMNRAVNEDSWGKAMFCGRCLHLYIPVVNSRIRYDGVLTIECLGCGGKYVFNRTSGEFWKDSYEDKEAKTLEYYFR